VSKDAEKDAAKAAAREAAKEAGKAAGAAKREKATAAATEKAAAAAAPVRAAGPAPKQVPARIKDNYTKTVVPRLMKEREYPNVMAVPRLKKIVVNMGVGEATQNIKVLDSAMEELGRITGQRPAVRRSRKSIAAFKLRQGMPIAATVTLRGDRMYEFVDRLFNVALPRVRDFRGVPTGAFDGRGNYTLGLKDQLIFPEVDYAKVEKMRGMNVTFVTSARTDEESKLLLQYLGMPFRTQSQ
jgi:large subunit ribosomal protein L5